MAHLQIEWHAPGLPATIVRLADLVEATYFAHNYIQAPDIGADVQRRLGTFMDTASKAHPHNDWPAAFKVITSLLGGVA